MGTLYWSPTDRPALSEMAVSAVLDDNAAGDTITYEQSYDSDEKQGTCGYLESSAMGTVVAALGARLRVTRLRVQFTTFHHSAYQQNNCVEPPVGDPAHREIGTFFNTAVEISDDGTTWQTAFTNPPTTGGSGFDGEIDVTFPAATRAAYVRFVGIMTERLFGMTGATVAQLRISDVRVTLGPTCPVPPPPIIRAVPEFAGGVSRVRILGNQ